MNIMNALHVVPKINFKVKQIISYSHFTLTPFPSTPKVYKAQYQDPFWSTIKIPSLNFVSNSIYLTKN